MGTSSKLYSGVGRNLRPLLREDAKRLVFPYKDVGPALIAVGKEKVWNRNMTTAYFQRYISLPDQLENKDFFVPLGSGGNEDSDIKALSGPTIPLSALDQAIPRHYLSRFYCFPYDDNTNDKNQTVSILKEGLRRSIMTLPFLTAAVAPAEGPKKGRLELRAGRGVQLIVKDLTNSPDIFKRTYAELDSMKMPISELDGNVLAPIGGLPPVSGTPLPVIAAQINFIKGGVLLCLSPHHTVLDGAGVHTILRLWAQHCRRVSGIKNDNGKEDNLILGPESVDKSLLLSIPQSVKIDDYHPQFKSPVAPPRPEVKQQQASTNTRPSIPTTTPPLDKAIFYFPSDSLVKLKSDVLSSKQVFSSPETITRLSINDALTAFIWSSISLARHTRHISEDTTASHTESTLGMAVSIRSRFSPALPPTFLGNAFTLLRASQRFPTSEDSLLQTAASSALSIRQGLFNLTEAHVRRTITYLDSIPDLSNFEQQVMPSLTDHVTITSRANFSPFELDWGKAFGGNKAEYVRFPDGGGDGICYILSRYPDGGTEVLVYLRKDDMANLKAIRALREYATLYEM